jgi:hypothetical protein
VLVLGVAGAAGSVACSSGPDDGSNAPAIATPRAHPGNLINEPHIVSSSPAVEGPVNSVSTPSVLHDARPSTQ